MMMSLLAGVLALAGCAKEKAAVPVMDGVTVDLPKLKDAFATVSPEIRVSVSEVAIGVKESNYPRAFAALAKLDSAPGLTEPQKTIVATVTDEVKQLASKAAAPPAQ